MAFLSSLSKSKKLSVRRPRLGSTGLNDFFRNTVGERGGGACGRDCEELPLGSSGGAVEGRLYERGGGPEDFRSGNRITVPSVSVPIGTFAGCVVDGLMTDDS